MLKVLLLAGLLGFTGIMADKCELNLGGGEDSNPGQSVMK